MEAQDLEIPRSHSPENLQPQADEVNDGANDEVTTAHASNITGRTPMRSTSVTFSDPPSFHHPPLHHNQRSSTRISSVSSRLEPPWKQQYVLSLDGGGIRGYSTLLIIRRLVDFIAEIERTKYQEERNVDPVPIRIEDHNSFHPHPPVALHDSSNGDVESGFRGIGFREIGIKLSPSGRGREQLTGQRTKTARQVENQEVDEKRIRRNKYLPCHYFDYMGGTSTGGLIAIMLSRLRMSIDSAIDQYQSFGGYIFGHPRFFSIRPSWTRPIPLLREKYDSKRLVYVVKDIVESQLGEKAGLVGQGLFTSHDRMCKTLAVSYGGRRTEDETVVEDEPPYLFRSYDHHPFVSKDPKSKVHFERNPGYSERIPIWQVARATSAAPTYFKSIEINNCKYGDGGFGLNNPTEEMYWEVYQMTGYVQKDIGILLSIGTGNGKGRWKYGQDGFGRWLGYIRTATKLAANSEIVHQKMLKMLRNMITEEDQIPYHRFNVPYHNVNRMAQVQESTSNTNAISNGNTADVNTPASIQSETLTTGPRGLNGGKRLGDMKLDEWKPPSRIMRRDCNTTLRDITSATETYLSDPEVDRELRRVAEILVDGRRSRCHTSHWELYSTGTQFRCMFPGCPSAKSQKMRPHKDSLKSHLIKSHGVESEEVLEQYVMRGKCLH